MKTLKSTLLAAVTLFAGSFFTSLKANKQDPSLVKPQQKTQQVKTNINKLDRKKRRHGQWEFYWDDNNTVVASKGKFKHGFQVKEWSYYTQDGKLERTEKQTLFGKRLKTIMYHPNGKVWKTGMARVVINKEYVDYYWYGDWKCYDEYGNYEKTERYIEGKLEGSEEVLVE